MKVKGIKRGKSIELLEQIDNIPDGTEVIIDLKLSSDKNIVTKQSLTDGERLAKFNKLFGTWKNQPDLMEIFE